MSPTLTTIRASVRDLSSDLRALRGGLGIDEQADWKRIEQLIADAERIDGELAALGREVRAAAGSGL